MMAAFKPEAYWSCLGQMCHCLGFQTAVYQWGHDFSRSTLAPAADGRGTWPSLYIVCQTLPFRSALMPSTVRKLRPAGPRRCYHDDSMAQTHPRPPETVRDSELERLGFSRPARVRPTPVQTSSLSGTNSGLPVRGPLHVCRGRRAAARAASSLSAGSQHLPSLAS